jgi:hypothetical protein
MFEGTGGLCDGRQETWGFSAMAKEPIGGITGVLGGLISSASPSEFRQSGVQPVTEKQSCPTDFEAPLVFPGHLHARLGRPPGHNSRQLVSREKVTFRIKSDLILKYRDWSWESRCQIGELVERALATYLGSHRQRQ